MTQPIKTDGGKVLAALFLFVLFLPGAALGFSATAQVDQTRISQGDLVSLQILVEGGGATVDLSPIRDFKVLSSATQTSRSYANGSFLHQVTYLYRLAPEKTGVLVIPPLLVKGDDKEVMTEEIQILCTEAPATLAQDLGFSARAELDTPRAVTGQQVVYTLRLYAPQTFAGAQFDPPPFKGLDARELTQWKKFTAREKGRAVVVNEIRFLLQARTPGTVEIEPAIFTVQEALARDQAPFDRLFNQPFFNPAQTRTVRVISNAATLEVLPLPPYTGTHPFSGLVGSFTLGAVLDKTRVAAGESATLSILVQGRGNVMDVGTLAPDLDQTLFKVYPDAPAEEIQATDQGLAGKKEFKLALVPRSEGKAVIPSVHLTFFDTLDQTYKTIATRPLDLEVLPATGAGGGNGSSAQAALPNALTEKQEVQVINRDILEIREEISAIESLSSLSPARFALWLLLPFAGFALVAAVLKHRDRQPDTRARLKARAKALAAQAKKAGPGSAEALSLLQGALFALIAAKGGTKKEALTPDEARAILEGQNTDPKEVAAVLDTMARLDRARFGRAGMTENEVKACMTQIQGWVRTLVLVAAAGALLALGGARAEAADPAVLFVDGVRDYQAGRFDKAVEGFEALARSGISNPDLFFNLGNAHLRAGDLGRAVLWYERAQRLSPTDPDIRFNLAHARSRVVDRIDTPADLLDFLFFWKGWISLFQLQQAAIGTSFLFFAWAALRIALRRRIFSVAGLAIFGLVCTLTLGAALEAFRLSSDARAVILNETVTVRSGTMETATPLFDLHQGAGVKVLEKKGDHIKISIARDKVGWIPLAAAEII